MWKKCSKCLVDYPKPFNIYFRKHCRTKDGLAYWCKNCADNYNGKYLKTKKGKAARKRALKNYRLSESGKRTQKKYKVTEKGKTHYAAIQRKHLLKKLYGLTLEDYNAMVCDQNGCCAICGIHQLEVEQKLHVDHNHKTGKVRGLLCPKCNLRLEPIEDIAFKIAAEEYLKNFTC